MKIAITCPASLPATQFGGIMFLCIHIAKKLSNDGHNITIYTTDLDFANNTNTFNKKLPKQEKIGNFTVKRSHVWFSSFLFFMNFGMYKQMMNDDYEIIHTMGIRSFQALISAIVSKRKKIPLVISDQGGLTTHPDLKESSFKKRFLVKLQKPLIKFIINQSSKVIVANEYEKNIFLQFCNASKISIVKNGIDLDELKSSNVDFRQKYKIHNEFILFLGRFHQVKGVDTLLEAINLIKNHSHLKELKIAILGVDFGFESQMEQKINEFNLSKNIIVIKKPPREDVISAYNQCKFLVLPSRWELSPLTPLEGFACKKTVISTTAHGIPYTITHNKNCLLVPPSNSQKLADAIIELLENPSKCQKLAESGFNMVNKEGNLDSMSNAVFKVYDDTIQSQKNEPDEGIR
ncbi:MAG: glycosyltransferase family 4 protein [Candidatus Nitrosopumilus sp. bin_68KS]